MDIDVLLRKLAKPAQRAIQGAGITTLELLSQCSQEEIMALHGIGKNAMRLIQETLAENGLSFKK